MRNAARDIVHKADDILGHKRRDSKGGFNPNHVAVQSKAVTPQVKQPAEKSTEKKKKP